MKIKLMNDGGFRFLSGVEFTVVVESLQSSAESDLAMVSTLELLRVGADCGVSELSEWSFLGDEFEVCDE